MVTIHQIQSLEILDSRGNPTLDVEVRLKSGATGRFLVPSGASTGSFEALELRDGDKKRYGGKGVLQACANVRGPIAATLKKLKDPDCNKIDETMLVLDGTPNKSKLGANAMLGVSVAFAKALAAEKGLPLYRLIAELSGSKGTTLPTPMMNVINGGRHADNALDFQEFMLVPAGFANYADALRASTEIFHTLRAILHKRKLSTGLGDEGGFAPDLAGTEAAIELLLMAISEAGYKPDLQFKLAIDCASTELWREGSYRFAKQGGATQSADQLIELYAGLRKKYPLVSIEDGLAEDDWDGWRSMTSNLGKSVQLVGDDLFVTNSQRLKKGIELKAANAILIKLNQIGTLTETLETIRLAKQAGFGVIISHRSGETEDSTIADLAVGTDAGQIKTGGLSRSERLAKYNRLLQITEELGAKGIYAGLTPFARLR